MSKTNSTTYISKIQYGVGEDDFLTLKDPNAIEREKDSDVPAILNFLNGMCLFGEQIYFNKENNDISFGLPKKEEQLDFVILDHFLSPTYITKLSVRGGV